MDQLQFVDAIYADVGAKWMKGGRLLAMTLCVSLGAVELSIVLQIFCLSVMRVSIAEHRIDADEFDNAGLLRCTVAWFGVAFVDVLGWLLMSNDWG